MQPHSDALTLAIQKNMPNVVLSLIYAGEPLNHNAANKKAPLHLALERGHTLIAQILSIYGANTKTTRAAANQAEQKEVMQSLDRLEKLKTDCYDIASATLIWAIKKLDSFTEHQTELFKKALDYLVGGGEYTLMGLKRFAQQHNRPSLVEIIDSKISIINVFFYAKSSDILSLPSLSSEQNNIYHNAAKGAVNEITNYNDAAIAIEYALKCNNFVVLERLSDINNDSLLKQLQNNRQKNLITFLTITTGKEIIPILEIKAASPLINKQEDKKQEPSPEGISPRHTQLKEQLTRLHSLTTQIEEDIEKKYSDLESKSFEKRYPRLSLTLLTLLLISEGLSIGLTGAYGTKVSMMNNLYGCDMGNDQCPKEQYEPIQNCELAFQSVLLVLTISLFAVALRYFERPFKWYTGNYDHFSSLDTFSEGTQNTAREVLDWEAKEDSNPFDRVNLTSKLGVFRRTTAKTKKDIEKEYKQLTDEKAQHRISIVEEKEPSSRRHNSWLTSSKSKTNGAAENEQPLLANAQQTPSAPSP